jgi:hypothetical protein
MNSKSRNSVHENPHNDSRDSETAMAYWSTKAVEKWNFDENQQIQMKVQTDSKIQSKAQNNYGYQLLKLVDDSSLPSTYYAVESKPKAGRPVMRILASISYFITFSVFAVLLWNALNQTTNETEISTADISGSDGWSCQMLSSVSQTYPLNGGFDPEEYYELIQINEVGSQCTVNFQETSPCSDPSQFFLVETANQPYTYPNTIKAFASVNNTLIFYVDSDLNWYALDLQKGTLVFVGQLYESNCDVRSYFLFTLGIDPSTGNCYFYCRQQDYYLYWQATSIDGGNSYSTAEFYTYYDYDVYGYYQFVGYYNEQTTGKLFGIVVYVSGRTEEFSGDETFYAVVDVLSTNGSAGLPVCILPDFNGQTQTAYFLKYGDQIDTLFVYIAVQSSVYNVSCNLTSGNSSSAFYMGQFLTSTFSENNYIYALAVQNSFVYYTVYNGGSNTGLVGALYDGYAFSNINPVAYGFSLMQNGYLLYSYNTGSSDFQINLCLPLEGGACVNASELMIGFTDSQVGWMICNKTLIPGNAINSNTQFSFLCSHNGIVWINDYPNTYYFMDGTFPQIAMNSAQQACTNSLYSTICSSIAYLPPYLCSRTVYQPFFTSLSTAVANAQALMGILFLLTGLALNKLSKRYPPNTDEKEEDAMKENVSTAKQRSESHGIELAERNSINPLVLNSSESPYYGDEQKDTELDEKA